MERKKYIIISVIVISISIIALIGTSYALLTMSIEGEKEISLTAGILKVDFSEGNNINLENAAPMSDNEGLKTTPYTFTITNTGNIDAYYHISLEEDINNTLSNNYVKMKLTGTNGYDSGIIKVNNYGEGTFEIRGEDVLEPEDSVTYTLYMWLDEEADNSAQGKIYQSKIVVESFDRESNSPNSPMLDEGMIAVTYNGTNWVKADRTNANNDWYNYDELKWANAVTVSESTRETYLNASNGTVINMDDIETMWVWIPRYSYSIGSEDGTNYYGKQGTFLDTTPTQALPGEIDVKFISENTKDRGSAKHLVSDGISDDDWYTPDAFTFGDEELRGIWVGKFETSSSNPSASYGGGNTTELDVMIKPNVTSWRMINISNAFNVSIKMNDNGNRYGFSSNVDTHMMKNSEWTIVAYLSQSKYGKLGNTNFSGANKEVYQNKSDSYITGCSYGTPSNTNTDYGCQYQYNIASNGTGASTTGNIYGIYDMVGGSWEYTMANYNDVVGSSGFNSPLTLESKYYNKYTSNVASESCNLGVCYSHALSETTGWYSDYQTMVTQTNPWLVRGGGYFNGIDAGVFFFNKSDLAGNASGGVSFRLVMSPSL